MAAPTGNKFWMLRSKHGRDKLFSTPELLWERHVSISNGVMKNPWLSKKAIQKDCSGKKEEREESGDSQ